MQDIPSTADPSSKDHAIGSTSQRHHPNRNPRHHRKRNSKVPKNSNRGLYLAFSTLWHQPFHRSQPIIKNYKPRTRITKKSLRCIHGVGDAEDEAENESGYSTESILDLRSTEGKRDWPTHAPKVGQELIPCAADPELLVWSLELLPPSGFYCSLSVPSEVKIAKLKSPASLTHKSVVDPPTRRALRRRLESSIPRIEVLDSMGQNYCQVGSDCLLDNPLSRKLSNSAALDSR
ncbi:hypothetical protein Nepgr_030878 [Nepenthes gracilis]|uniref:Uncharacterized protein n=1 Tax=Nepenthes gracilis TaxID=150966 RepID=A0AAD3TG93_NEPGR|nr:hypothetical protein Nepgr_030878 [Nepenthes gracilis]